MKLSELQGQGGGGRLRLSDVEGGGNTQSAPYRPTGPIPGDPGYVAPTAPQATRNPLRDVLTQGGRYDPDTAAHMLAGDVATFLGSAMGGEQAPTEAIEKGVSAVGRGALAAGKAVGKEAAAVPGRIGEALVSATPRRGAPTAIELGYVLPPKMAVEKPTATSNLLSALGGKVKLDHFASEANQKITNRLAAKELGLPKDTVLTDNVFDTVRKEAGKAYDAIRDILPPVRLDNAYRAAVSRLGGATPELQKMFPSIARTNPMIESLKKELVSHDEVTPGHAMELLKRLRHDASANFKVRQDPDRWALGIAQQQAAHVIEDMMDRSIATAPANLAAGIRSLREEQAGLVDLATRASNEAKRLSQRAPAMAHTPRESLGLQAAIKEREDIASLARDRLSKIDGHLRDYLGKAKKLEDLRVRDRLINNFRAARQRIAKSYDVERATNTATGDVAAHRIDALRRAGRPLSGHLKTISDTYRAFPQAMRAPESFGHPEQFSVLDMALGGGGLIAGHPGALSVLARPLARTTVLSRPYQQLMVGGPQSAEDVLSTLGARNGDR